MKLGLSVALILLCVTTAFAQNFKWNKNHVIAHRGAFKTKNLPENSIASLKEAIRLGCYGSEFDVYQTQDGVLVINHDPHYQGMTIAETTYAELSKHPLSNGESIPTLEAYLRTGTKQRSMKLILEIKPVSDVQKMKEITDAVFAMVQRFKARPWVEYISFSYECLLRIKELDPKAPTAYLTGNRSLEQLKADGISGADYHYDVVKKGEWFDTAKKLGLTMNVWTVNDVNDINWLLDHPGTFITTNEPELVFQEMNKRKGNGK